MITQSFDLNLIPESSPVVVHCDQYDKGTGRLVISLYDENIAYSPSGTAKIQGVKPDGKGFEYDASISGNVVTANLTEQMSAVAGRVRCQIVVTETTGRTGSFAFILDVQPSALPLDTDISESDYQLIEQALEDCAQAVIDSQDNAEDAEAWAVGERGGVPVGPTDPTYENNAEYWSQIAAQYAQGGWHYMGSIPFSQLPTSGMVGGDMYNITDDFVTDSRFIEGEGHQCYAGQNVSWVASVSKWDLPAIPRIVPDMTSSTKGIGRPDGKTTEVSSGVFNAIGVSIPAEVNSGATQYASNWLYYEGTTEVITPSTKQNYRATYNNQTKLYYWTGSAYAELTSGGGGGGGMNTDGSNADASIVFPSDSISSGAYAKSSGGLAFCNEQAATSDLINSLQSIPANTTTETRILNIHINSYPVVNIWLESSNKVTATKAMTSDVTKTYNNATIRVHKEGNYIEVWATNTNSSSVYCHYTWQSYTESNHDSLSVGKATKATGDSSVSTGISTDATGKASYAGGYHSRATKDYAHAEGFSTRAEGIGAFSIGSNSAAGGNFAFAQGSDTKASSVNQAAFGKYNIEDTQDAYAFLIGNGTSNTRSNALSVDWSGNLEVAGNVTAGNGLSIENIGEGLASINTTGATNTTGSTINAGTYFYLNGVLVRALADIANGASYTLNTNYEVVTAGALNELSDIYSVTEKVIGTYMGKPRYRRVYTGNLGTLVQNTFTNIALDFQLTYRIVNAYGWCEHSDGRAIIPYVFARPNIEQIFGVNYVQSTGQINLYYYLNTPAFNNGDYNVVIEYTKTTD